MKRRCRFHGGHSLEGIAHPRFTHGKRTRGLREVFAKIRAAADLSWYDMLRLSALVRQKRAELVALVLTIEEMQGMIKAEIRAYLGLPLSPCDVGIPRDWPGREKEELLQRFLHDYAHPEKAREASGGAVLRSARLAEGTTPWTCTTSR